MADRAAEIRERDRRRLPPVQTATEQTRRTDGLAPMPPSVIGIIRSVDTAAGVIKWQRIAYKNNPPVAGQLEATGPLLDGYPLETARAEDYEVWAWPDRNGDPTLMAVPIRASRRGGVWIIEVMFKPDGSVLDPGEEMPGCNFG